MELIHLCVQAAEVKCIAGDLIKDPELVQRTVASEGPFDAVVHAVGMILPNSLNALASGSGSKPAEGVTPVFTRLYCVCETTDSPFAGNTAAGLSLTRLLRMQAPRMTK